MQMILHLNCERRLAAPLNRSNLGNDVGAIAVLLDHFLQAAHLALDRRRRVLIGLLQTGIDSDGFAPPASDAQAQFAMLGRSSSLGPRIDFAVLDVMIPSTPIYTLPSMWCQTATDLPAVSLALGLL